MFDWVLNASLFSRVYLEIVTTAIRTKILGLLYQYHRRFISFLLDPK